MNNAQKNAIQQAIDNLNDSLYRAQMTAKRNPHWKSGNDEPIANIIAGYEKAIAELESND